MSDESKNSSVVERKPDFVMTLKAVLWAFIGIRRSKDHNSDMVKLNPVHVVIVGICAAAGLVVTLILVVKWVLSHS